MAEKQSNIHAVDECIEIASISPIYRTYLRAIEFSGRAAIEGHFSHRADSNAHEGEFRSVTLGVNGTLDELLAPVGEARTTLAAG